MTYVNQKIVAVLVALAQIVLIANGYTVKLEHIDTEDQAVNILIPGLLGFGEDTGASRAVPYFGVLTGVSISEALEEEGYETYQASVGPMSSEWDRACELYAMLTGTQVDYGKAHSKACGHSRYGRVYEAPLFDNWSAERPVNLIGHSFGGNTARMFALLCAEGSAEERAATEKDELSPLFQGGMIDRIHSVTSLASPHNGSVALGVMHDDYDEDGFLLIGKVLYTMGHSKVVNGVYDLQLEHFGISVQPGTDEDPAWAEKTKEEAAGNFVNSMDHAFRGCSLDGAADLNKIDKIHDSVYYFSYSSSVTEPSPVLQDKQMPVAREVLDPILFGYATQIGLDIGKTSAPDEDWLVSDGMVSVPSAVYPEGQPYQTFTPGKTKLEPGVWNVMPTLEKVDHAYWCGGDMSSNSEEEIMDIYLQLMHRLDETY